MASLYHLIPSQLIAHCTAGNIYSRKLARRLLRWSLAFIVTTKISLRGDSDLGELTEIMSPDELKVRADESLFRVRLETGN